MKKYLKQIWFIGMMSLTISACNIGKKESAQKDDTPERDFQLKDGNYKLVNIEKDDGGFVRNLPITHSDNYIGFSVKWVSDDVFRFSSTGQGEIRFHGYASGQLSCPDGRTFDIRIDSSGVMTELVTIPKPYAPNCKLGQLAMLDRPDRKKYIKVTQIDLTPKGFSVHLDFKRFPYFEFHNLKYGAGKKSKMFFEFQP